MSTTTADKKLTVNGFSDGAGRTGVQSRGLDLRTVCKGVAVCAGYYAAAKVSLALRFPSNPLAVVWLPNGVLLAALLLAPRRWWWFYLVAAVPAHFAMFDHYNLPIWRQVWLMIFNSGLSVLIASGLLRFGIPPLKFDQIRQVGVYVFLAAALTAVASPTAPRVVQASIEAVTGRESWLAPLIEWRRVFMGNFLAYLLLTPMLVLWADQGIAGLHRISGRRAAETVLICIGLAAVSVLSIVTGASLPAEAPVLLYSFFPFLLWAAVRLCPLVVSSLLLWVATVSLCLAVHGYGPFGWTSTLDGLFPLQLFLVFVSIMVIFLTAEIAERGKVEEGLRESEVRFRSMADTAPVMIWMSGPDNGRNYFNQRWLDFTGRTHQEESGDGWTDNVHPEDVGHVVAGYGAACEAREAFKVEYRLRRHDGQYRWILAQAVPRLTADGNFLGYVGLCLDITDRKQAEDAIQNLAHIQRLAIVGELTASIAHEINQPLNAALNNADAAEMLLESKRPRLDEVRQILADIRTANLRAAEVVRRTRMLLRKREIQMLPINLNETISDVLGLAAGDARRRRIVLTSDFAFLPSQILGDKVHLQQLLLNLLLNGMDAMADVPAARRRLTVRTAQRGDGSVEVAVSDSGHGIAPERLPNLFESFRSTKKEGLGLGLPIAHSIIEAHHGRIWGENNAWGGATFRFILPGGTGAPALACCQTGERDGHK